MAVGCGRELVLGVVHDVLGGGLLDCQRLHLTFQNRSLLLTLTWLLALSPDAFLAPSITLVAVSSAGSRPLDLLGCVLDLLDLVNQEVVDLGFDHA